MRMGCKIFLLILGSLALGIVSYAGYSFYSIYQEDKEAVKVYSDIASKYQTEVELIDDVKSSIVNVITEDEIAYNKAKDEFIKKWQGTNYDALKKINSDYICTIEIPQINISYPVVSNSEKNADYYLTHTFDKSKNSAGTIFLDYLFERNLYNNHLIMFGHNMKNQSMFGGLSTFLDVDLVQPIYIYMYNEDVLNIYQLYSVYNAETGSETYTAYFNNKEHYEDYFTMSLENATGSIKNIEDVNILSDKGNQILTLSTCYGTKHKEYTIWQCINVERIEYDEEVN